MPARRLGREDYRCVPEPEADPDPGAGAEVEAEAGAEVEAEAGAEAGAGAGPAVADADPELYPITEGVPLRKLSMALPRAFMAEDVRTPTRGSVPILCNVAKLIGGVNRGGEVALCDRAAGCSNVAITATSWSPLLTNNASRRRARRR